MKEVLEKLKRINTYENWRFGFGDDSFNELVEIFLEAKKKQFRIELFEKKPSNLSIKNSEQVDEFFKLSNRILLEKETVLAIENPIYLSIVENDSYLYKRYASRIICDDLLNISEDNTEIFFKINDSTIGYRPLTINLRFDIRVLLAISKTFNTLN